MLAALKKIFQSKYTLYLSVYKVLTENRKIVSYYVRDNKTELRTISCSNEKDTKNIIDQFEKDNFILEDNLTNLNDKTSYAIKISDFENLSDLKRLLNKKNSK